MAKGIGITPLLNWSRSNARLDNEYLREIFAEFFGTFILCFFSVGGTCQIRTMNTSFIENPVVANYAQAFGYFIAYLLFGGVSGANINPSVSIGLALAGKISWIKLHAFVIVQFFGGYLGSLLGFGLFKSYLQRIVLGLSSGSLSNEPNSVLLFVPTLGHISVGAGFANEIVLTSIFMMTILAVKDMWNTRSPRYVQGIIIGLVVIGLGQGFGAMTGCMLNPARDISPRIAALTLGWSSDSVMKSAAGGQWWCVGLLAPTIGAIIGTVIYVFVIGAQVRVVDEDSFLGDMVTVDQNGFENQQHEWRQTVFVPKIQVGPGVNRRTPTPTTNNNNAPYRVQFTE